MTDANYSFELSENLDGRDEPVSVGVVTVEPLDRPIRFDYRYAVGGNQPLAVRDFVVHPQTGEVFYVGRGLDFEKLESPLVLQVDVIPVETFSQTYIWHKPRDAGSDSITHYEFRWREEPFLRPGGDGKWSEIYSTTSRSITIDELENGSAVNAQVRAVSAAGASAWRSGHTYLFMRGEARAVVTISVLDAPDPPLRPQPRQLEPSLVLGAPDHAAVRVLWINEGETVRPPITAFSIRYSSDTAAAVIEVDRADVNSRGRLFEYDVEGLSADTEYRFEVRTHNAEGVTDWVALGTIRTGPAG